MTSPRTRQNSDACTPCDPMLIHDLRGPTLNAKAFNNELIEAIESLCDLLSNPERALSEEDRRQISEILNSDALPCAVFVCKALTSLEERLISADNAGTGQ